MGEEKPREDRRISRTRKLIAEAFIALLESKSFEELTVADLTERAEINRSTFYAHYLDKFDLRDKLIKEHLQLLAEVLGAHSLTHAAWQAAADSPSPYYAAYFEHLLAHARFYAVMLGQNDVQFHPLLLGLLRESHFSVIAGLKLEQKLLVPTDILLDYASSSMMGMTVKWFENGQKYSPRYMALQLSRLAALGVDRAMGKALL